MKDKILIFLLGFFVAVSLAATSLDPTPEQPRQTIVKSFRASFLLENDIKEYIESMVRQGYVVKSVAMMDDENWSKGIVVMEKY